jgi:hypothetical protein
MKFLLVQPNSNPWREATICAIGTLSEMQAQKQLGQHIIALLHEGIYRFEVGGPVMYDYYARGYLTGDGLCDGTTCIVDTIGT